MSEEPSAPNPNPHPSDKSPEADAALMTADGARLKLRPRLSAEPPAAESANSAGQTAESAPTEEAPLIKLRPRGSIPSFPPPVTTPPEVANEAIPSVPKIESAPVQVSVSAPPSASVPVEVKIANRAPKPPPLVSADRPPIPARKKMPAELVTPPIEPPVVVKNKKSKSLLALAVLGLVALSAGYFAYQNYFKSPPPPPPRPVTKKAAAPTPQAPVVTPAPVQPSASVPVARSTAVVPAERKSDNSGPTPSATLNALAAAPIKAVNRARSVVDQRRDADQVNVGKILDEAAPVAPSAVPAPKKAETPVRPTTIPLKLALDNVSTPRAVAPGVVAGTDVRATNEASVAFRSYIANAKIGGVFQGQPTRVLINGRIVRPGDSVDEKLAITFIEVEAVDRLLVFKDGTDARVTRRY